MSTNATQPINAQRLIYLASPYAHPDPMMRELRFVMAMQSTASMMREGMTVYSAIVHCHPIQKQYQLPTEWEFWQVFGETMISRCDELHVLMLDGWEDSVGVKAEIAIAERLDKPIRYVEYEKDSVILTGRQELIAHLSQEEDSARIFAIVVTSEGDLAGYHSGVFHTWEMQGILEFFKVRAEISAANSFVMARDDEGEDDESDRVVG